MRRVLAFAACLLVATPAFAAKRVALVIGNGSYQSLSTLDNPTRDAVAVAGVLRANGFDVSEHTDLDRADFLDALESFREDARGADLAVVFYAGHGMEIDGKDVIAPVDMAVACENRELKRAVPVDALFEAANGATDKVMLIDACRSDPFPQCPKRGAEAGGFRGLSRITTAGSTLIASATLSGSVAADGLPGAHSPFAQPSSPASRTAAPCRSAICSTASPRTCASPPTARRSPRSRAAAAHRSPVSPAPTAAALPRPPARASS